MDNQTSPWPVVGHDWAVALLTKSMSAGRLAHAYLFSGPPQVGKTTLARALAQALNCQSPEVPCGRCSACKRIERGTHPDVRVIVGDGAGKSIKIEQMRAMQHEAMLAPYEGRRRVIVLRQMDQASLEASNSLLKTLEEPPPQVTLILTAVRSEALPRTVVSRCQRLELRPVPSGMVEAELGRRGVAETDARLLARLSGGRLGWALQAAQDGDMLRQRREGLDRLARLLNAGRVERLDAAQMLSRDVAGARQTVELWTGWWRDVLLCQSAPAHGHEDFSNVDRVDEIKAVGERLPAGQALNMLETLQMVATQLEANVNPRLAMEGLMLRLPRPGAADGGGTRQDRE